MASWLVGEAELTKLKTGLELVSPLFPAAGPSEALVRLLAPLLTRDLDESGGRNNLMK